jgi:dihydropteroate synthase
MSTLAQPAPFRFKGNSLDFSVPRIMGVLNATPDSFHGASRVTQAKEAAQRALQMVADGADVLDIGGQSSRPGAAPLSADEELSRVLPVIEEIRTVLPECLLSIDTFQAEVARRAIGAGCDIINDIGAGRLDPQMEGLMADLNVPCILMHMQGTPETMQERPQYAHPTDEVLAFLSERIDTLRAKGVEQLAVDPGFGFGKTQAHNFQLLDQFGRFAQLGVPVLAGVSRKSMIYKTLDSTPGHALNGTSVLHAWALDRGAHILRVHDVAEARECVKLHGALTQHRTPLRHD